MRRNYYMDMCMDQVELIILRKPTIAMTVVAGAAD